MVNGGTEAGQRGSIIVWTAQLPAEPAARRVIRRVILRVILRSNAGIAGGLALLDRASLAGETDTLFTRIRWV